MLRSHTGADEVPQGTWKGSPQLPGSFLLDKTSSILDNNKFQKEAGYLAEEIQNLTGIRPAFTDIKKSKQIILQYDEHFTPESGNG
jgi:hypothetical protein